jgi:hypothetical protein
LSESSTGTTVGQLGYPTDVSVDTYGTVYALSGGGLYRFYVGSTLGTLVVTNYQYGFSFKFDSIGNVYLADYGANEIKKSIISRMQIVVRKSFSMSYTMTELTDFLFFSHRK